MSDLNKGNLSAQNEIQLNEFMLLTYFFEETLKNQVVEQAQALGVKGDIDMNLIDEVLKEETASKETSGIHCSGKTGATRKINYWK